MTLALSAELEALRSEVRRFVEGEIEPRSRWIEENDAIPGDLVAKMRAMGLYGLNIPEAYGGIGLDLLGKCVIEEELGRSNSGVAHHIGNQTGISTNGIIALGTEAQKQKYLPRIASGEWIGSFALTEPQAGSNPAEMRTSAERRGDRYVLNGEKIYITNAGLAQVFTVMAITDRSRGVQGISAFIVERGFPGLRVGRNELKMGMHGCTTAPVYLEDCEVPAENLLGREGQGYVQALKTLTQGRITVSFRALGMMSRLIERSVEYMKLRTQGGRALAEYQGLQWMLADMALARDASRLLSERALETLRAGGRGTLEAAMAKLHTTEALAKVADCAVQIHGGMGYMREAGIETVMRDARIMRIYEGTSEIQRNIIAGQLLRGD